MSGERPGARPQKEKAPDLAGSEASGIEGLPQRVVRYGDAKKRALDVAEYISTHRLEVNDKTTARRVNKCGSYLLFRHYLEPDLVRLHAAEFCKKHLLCPLCAIRRGAKALDAYLTRWEVIRTEKAALRPFLVTLTVKDGPDLAERFRHLKGSFQRLQRRANRQRGNSAWEAVKGAVWSYEVKKGKGSGAWHPHLHAIALCEAPPSQARLSREWHELTGDSFIVDVRPIEGDPAEGFMEVFKYAVKFADMTPAQTVEAWRTLRGIRLLDSGGLFRGVEVPEELTDEPLEGPFVEWLYRWFQGRGYGITQD